MGYIRGWMGILAGAVAEKKKIETNGDTFNTKKVAVTGGC